jgi:sporulation protein YlmC with PRC-barrel domain
MLGGVLLLSGVTGRPVSGPDGRALGHVADLSVRFEGESGPHVVNRVVVTRRGGATLLVPWAAVEVFDPAPVRLAADGFEVTSLAEALGPDELLLRRDVLDTQVVDVVGQRLARVADVLLEVSPATLELCGVEVGFSGVLRRLGLGGNAIGGRMGQDVVAWSDVHLTSDRGHAVQLSAPRAAVHRLDSTGLAALVSRVDTESATEILAARDPALAADAVRAAHPDVGERILRAMPGTHAARILASMPAEHAEHWRRRLAHNRFRSRRFLRSGVWPHRRHLIREPRR